MKKLIALLLISTIITATIFAKTKTVVQDSDYYEEEVSTSEIQEEDDKAPFFNFQSSSSKKYNYGQELTFNTFNAINQIKQTEGYVIYNNKTDTFGFCGPYMVAYYAVFMDQTNRDLLSKAYNNYLQDFANKKLNRKDKKSAKAYGKITLSLNWGTIKASTPSRGVAKATLGYGFYNNSPYFTITIPSTFNDYSVDNDVVAKESMSLKYAFTKAQMAELLECLSDEKLASLTSKKSLILQEAEVDSYSDEADVTEEIVTEETTTEDSLEEAVTEAETKE